MKKLAAVVEHDTVIYRDMKGKLFEEVRIDAEEGAVWFELVFADQTQMRLRVECAPSIEASLFRNIRGNLKLIGKGPRVSI